MMYLVGVGNNSMKSNFIYAYPKSKISKKQFKAEGEQVSVINIASGNVYTIETDLVGEEQMFSSLSAAAQFADQEIDEVRININLKKYLSGELNDANIRDIFEMGSGVVKKVNEAIQEVVKPTEEAIKELKEMIGVYQDNLNDMHSKVKELESIAYEEVQKLKAKMPSTHFKSPSYEWTEEDFAKITKLNNFLETITQKS